MTPIFHWCRPWTNYIWPRSTAFSWPTVKFCSSQYPYEVRTSTISAVPQSELGNWFWNNGAQKSLASFNSLVDIITSPDFWTSDICNIKWDQINTELSHKDIGEWVDEDTGWTCTSISLSIPHQAHCGNYAPQMWVLRIWLSGTFTTM